MKVKAILLLFMLVFSIFYTANVFSNENKITPKLLYENKCSRCHELDKITQAIKAPDQWSYTVHRMREKDKNWISQGEA